MQESPLNKKQLKTHLRPFFILLAVTTWTSVDLLTDMAMAKELTDAGVYDIAEEIKNEIKEAIRNGYLILFLFLSLTITKTITIHFTKQKNHEKKI